MAKDSAIFPILTITAKDINGNNVAKIFSSVSALHFDYVKGMISITDGTVQFYFPITPLTTVTYTINGTAHTIVMS